MRNAARRNHQRYFARVFERLRKSARIAERRFLCAAQMRAWTKTIAGSALFSRTLAKTSRARNKIRNTAGTTARADPTAAAGNRRARLSRLVAPLKTAIFYYRAAARVRARVPMQNKLFSPRK